MSETVIDLIRHGLPEGGNRIRGNGVDDPLSAAGWAQMRTTTSALGGWQRVVASPMRRCRAFAESLADDLRLPLAVVADLREVGFGSWEGIARTTLQHEHRAEYDAFYRDPVNNRPAGAEPLADFGRRVDSALEAVRTDHSGRRVLVVTHAGVIRAALGHALQIPLHHWYRIDADYAGLTRLASDEHHTRVLLHNWRPEPTQSLSPAATSEAKPWR